MSKTELTSRLAAATGLTKTKASEVLDAIFNPTDGIIAGGVKADGVVAIQGFGSFKRTERAARVGTKPGTKERITIPASTSVRFNPGKPLRETVGKR